MSEFDVAVVDASVVVEYLVELPLTPQATQVFRRLTDAEPLELWAPDLLHLEVASTLRKLVCLGSITAAEGRRSLLQLLRLPIRTTGTGGLLLEMWKQRDRITPYDAAYLLLARELAAPLITADAKLARAAPRGWRVLLLQQWEA